MTGMTDDVGGRLRAAPVGILSALDVARACISVGGTVLRGDRPARA